MADLATLHHALAAAAMLIESFVKQNAGSDALPENHIRTVGQALDKIHRMRDAVHEMQPELREIWLARGEAELESDFRLGDTLRRAQDLALTQNMLDAILLLTQYGYHETSPYNQEWAFAERDRLERQSSSCLQQAG